MLGHIGAEQRDPPCPGPSLTLPEPHDRCTQHLGSGTRVRLGLLISTEKDEKNLSDAKDKASPLYT